MNVQTLKGFRDFLPQEARKRQYIMETLKKVFESYGFEPLETPALEYESILTGKYGEEGDKLMYKFEDNGKRKVALRYDQTVPTARVVAQYQAGLPMPFKRYQMQNVYRADNTQRGRYREFMQCDIDTIGTKSLLADAEILAAVINGYKALGFTQIKVLINDRKIFEGLENGVIAVIDKLKKIGKEGVCKELVEKKYSKDNIEAQNLLQSIIDAPKTEALNTICNNLDELGIDNETYEYSPTLARGLDYYTGMIFEVEIPQYTVGSVCGGGRYDNLIGMFAERQIPAVGCAFGFDRTLEAMEELNLFPQDITNASALALVTIFSPDFEKKSLEIYNFLRSKKVPSEIWLDPTIKLEKQMKYADQKKIQFVIIAGPQEIGNKTVTVKNLKTREQTSCSLEEAVKIIQ